MTTSAGKPSSKAALRCVALLTCGQRESHGTSQTSNGHMNLGAQATARAADRLIFRPPFLAPAACWWARTMVESTIRYSKSGSSDIASKYPPPNTLDAPSAEAPEHAVPISKHLRKITPGSARTHDPQHAFHEHPIVAPGGAFLVRSTYDQRRYPFPRRVAQNQTVLHTQDCLPKNSLESDLLLKGNP